MGTADQHRQLAALPGRDRGQGGSRFGVRHRFAERFGRRERLPADAALEGWHRSLRAAGKALAQEGGAQCGKLDRGDSQRGGVEQNPRRAAAGTRLSGNQPGNPRRHRARNFAVSEQSRCSSQIRLSAKSYLIEK